MEVREQTGARDTMPLQPPGQPVAAAAPEDHRWLWAAMAALLLLGLAVLASGVAMFVYDISLPHAGFEVAGAGEQTIGGFFVEFGGGPVAAIHAVLGSGPTAGHSDEVTAVSISPQSSAGQSILTGSRDGTCILWLAVDWNETEDAADRRKEKPSVVMRHRTP